MREWDLSERRGSKSILVCGTASHKHVSPYLYVLKKESSKSLIISKGLLSLLKRLCLVFHLQ